MNGKYSADWWEKFALSRRALGGPDDLPKIEPDDTRMEVRRDEPASRESNNLAMQT